jgi:hypothetical protein
MKRSIIAAVAALMMATIAQAGPITKLSSNGWWDVSYNASNRNGNPMCVMAAKYDWANGTNGAVYVKWTEVGARWQVWRSDWRMPYGSTVPMSVTFIDLDPNAPPPQTITAAAKAINDPGLISFDINKDDLVPFLKVFGDAEKITISFPQSDTQWTMMMDGSRNAAASFEQCITKLAAALRQHSPCPERHPSRAATMTSPTISCGRTAVGIMDHAPVLTTSRVTAADVGTGALILDRVERHRFAIGAMSRRI